MKQITQSSVHAHVRPNTITAFIPKDNEILHIANIATKNSLDLLQSIVTIFVKVPCSEQNSFSDGFQEKKQELVDNTTFPITLNVIFLTNITANVVNVAGRK